MKITLSNSDTWGIWAGALCMIHCFATPFLFIALAGSSVNSEEAPLWWLSINYIFLLVSFFAVLRSSRTTARYFIKPLLWISWVFLSFVIINEQFGWLELKEVITYLAASLLVGLHIYNRRYCRCDNDKCCLDHE